MAIALAAVLVLAVAAGLTATRRPDPFDQAFEALGDPNAFGTAYEAAETFLDVSQYVQLAGERCVGEHGEGSDRCDAMFAAAGYFRVLALQVLRCRLGQIAEIRDESAIYLRNVAAEEPVEIPELPICE